MSLSPYVIEPLDMIPGVGNPGTKLPPRFELTCENLAWLAVALGVVLRVWEYLEFRELYMDEKSLLMNLVGRSIFDFHHVLEQDQMAPPLFLVIERIMVRLPLEVKAAGRLFPLACGVASVFFMRSGRAAVPRPPRRADCRGPVRAGRSPALLLGRDQAVFVRSGPGAGRALAGRSAAARRAEPAPALGSLRLRPDRSLVLVPGGVRAGGSGLAPLRLRAAAEERAGRRWSRAWAWAGS